MPLRFPPGEPEPLKQGATRSQVKRYEASFHAWLVGNALREYAKTLNSFSRRYVPDDLGILSSPRFDGVGGRRLADNGTPASMDDLCGWLDRQNRTVLPVSRSYNSLKLDLPQVASVAWKRHVDLWTIEEIATYYKVTKRTVLRHLGVANLRLMAALDASAYSKTARRESRALLRQADALEAEWHRLGDEDTESTNDDRALAGETYKEEEKKKRRK